MASSIRHDIEAPAGEVVERGALDEAQRRLALQGFLAANYERLRSRLTRQLGCVDLASECLHDAWLRLCDVAVRSDVQYPEAYVYRAACNAAMDRLRSDRSWQYTDDADTELEHLGDGAPGPDHIAAARADLAAVERAMQRLPHRHRAVLIALRIDEMTRDEVARRHDLSLRRVDTTLRQALDYCAQGTGQQVLAGMASARHALEPLLAQRLPSAESRTQGQAAMPP